MEQEQYMQAVMLGQVLTRAISTEVEPFSGNALYYPLSPELAVEILNGIGALFEAPNTEISPRVGV